MLTEQIEAFVKAVKGGGVAFSYLSSLLLNFKNQYYPCFVWWQSSPEQALTRKDWHYQKYLMTGSQHKLNIVVGAEPVYVELPHSNRTF